MPQEKLEEVRPLMIGVPESDPDVSDSCFACLRFRRPLLQSVVGWTLGNKFNDTVYLDLKEYGYNQYWIEHLIDTPTKYSARLIKTKRSEEIICTIFLM